MYAYHSAIEQVYDRWKQIVIIVIPVPEAVESEKRKQRSSHPAHTPHPTIYICHKCGRDCDARVGLISHSRKC